MMMIRIIIFLLPLLYAPITIANLTNFSTKININKVPVILRGACFFGSGEGGSLKSALKLFQIATKESFKNSKFTLVNDNDLQSKNKIILTALYGAPSSAFFLNNYRYMTNNRRLNEAYFRKYKPTGRSYHNIVFLPVENGSNSILYPILDSLALNANVYNGDAAGGRSVPSMLDTSLASLHINPNGMQIFCNNNLRYVPTSSSQSLQRSLHRLANRYNQLIAFSTYYMNSDKFSKLSLQTGTISKDLLVGQAMQHGTIAQSHNAVIKLLKRLYGKNKVHILFDGRLLTLKTFTANQTKGYIELKALHTNNFMRIYFYHENILATTGTLDHGKYIEQKFVAMAPDSIDYLLPKGLFGKRYYGGLSITNSDIFHTGLKKLKGLEIEVIKIPAPKLRTPWLLTRFRHYINMFVPKNAKE